MKWRGRYTLEWCAQCEHATIRCPTCGLISCSGSSCTACFADFSEFLRLKTSPVHYLSQEEQEVFTKYSLLKEYIQECLSAGLPGIDWAWLRDAGSLSEQAEELFKKELLECRRCATPNCRNYASDPRFQWCYPCICNPNIETD